MTDPDFYRDFSENEIRKIAHEEIVKYHFYGVRARLVLRQASIQMDLKHVGVAVGDMNDGQKKMLAGMKADLRGVIDQVKEVDEIIEKVGKFDTNTGVEE